MQLLNFEILSNELVQTSDTVYGSGGNCGSCGGCDSSGCAGCIGCLSDLWEKITGNYDEST